MAESTYPKKGVCLNCGHKVDVDIPKEISVEAYFRGGKKCPNCDLKKIYEFPGD